MYTVGRLAREGGVNLQTVRFYERKGLLAPDRRTASGYRRYGKEALRCLRFIKRAQRLGFTLREVSELLSLKLDSPRACGEVLKRTERKLAEVRGKIGDLERLEETLEALVENCRKRRRTEGCPILECVEGEAYVPGKKEGV